MSKDPSFKVQYYKSKTAAKIWEIQFQKQVGRKPTREEIHNADTAVKQAYYNYWYLKKKIKEEFKKDSEDLPSTLTNVEGAWGPHLNKRQPIVISKYGLPQNKIQNKVLRNPRKNPKTLKLSKEDVSASSSDSGVGSMLSTYSTYSDEEDTILKSDEERKKEQLKKQKIKKIVKNNFVSATIFIKKQKLFDTLKSSQSKKQSDIKSFFNSRKSRS